MKVLSFKNFEHHADIIGDIHGYCSVLVKLLKELGYKQKNGVWQHEKRIAIFCGDLVDRGSEVLETLKLVRNMVEHDKALLLMGNHELYSLLYNCYNNKTKKYLREHNSRTNTLYQQTAKAFKHKNLLKQDYLNWFFNLPIAIDFSRFRVAHAGWNNQNFLFWQQLIPNIEYSYNFLEKISQPGQIKTAIDRFINGVRIKLPSHYLAKCSDSKQRNILRTTFWLKNPQTYYDVAFPCEAKLNLALKNLKLKPKDKAKIYIYHITEKPLIIGHYCISGQPDLLTENIVCIDYGVYLTNSKLVAYRFDKSETKLNRANLIWVKNN